MARASYALAGGQPMFEVISANSILVWFVWGFIMALGWTLGAWAIEHLLGYLPWESRRNIR
jgi:hypothetical protein